ncbi:hypothetical protein BLNAU_7821 [Blattamonas nauphoetae]|uniref:Uncharacterized protein n=1 Tax=Blattamonas nauphoetae TaxID=2049346 RepID=A0ABQ9Y0G0_9EUKA|nr:hypothetical protein BLNAU_7821 [Blattamonas nauphoetae]
MLILLLFFTAVSSQLSCFQCSPPSLRCYYPLCCPELPCAEENPEEDEEDEGECLFFNFSPDSIFSQSINPSFSKLPSGFGSDSSFPAFDMSNFNIQDPFSSFDFGKINPYAQHVKPSPAPYPQEEDSPPQIIAVKRSKDPVSYSNRDEQKTHHVEGKQPRVNSDDPPMKTSTQVLNELKKKRAQTPAGYDWSVPDYAYTGPPPRCNAQRGGMQLKRPHNPPKERETYRKLWER